MSTNASPTASKLLHGRSPHVLANGQEPGVVAIRLRDDCNNPVAGRTVVLIADREDVTIEQPGPTDQNGLALGYIRTSVPGPVIVNGIIQPLPEPEATP